MDRSRVWSTPRLTIFLGVLAIHAALLALLLFGSRTQTLTAATEHSIDLMLLPPRKIPKVSIEFSRVQRLSTDMPIVLAPPVLNPVSPAGLSSEPDGRGSVVNWAAEAHRAIRAFEIRRDQPTTGATFVSDFADGWWPPREHHVGMKVKTPNGDWVVWIDPNCYQVATGSSKGAEPGETEPATVCLPENHPSRDQ
jgi:hypothetical protein